MDDLDPTRWPTYAGGLAALLILAAWSFSRPKRNLPPGPKGLPILGNVFQLPPFPWLKFTEWKDQYGPIFSLNLAGQPVVVLNTTKIAADLLDRRSTIYSDRPKLIMAGEILTGDVAIPLARYGGIWQKLRKAAHEGLSPRAAEKYQPLQRMEAATLARDMIEDPKSWGDHLQRSAASSVLCAVYGIPPIASKDDPLVTRIMECVHRTFHATVPGAFLVDIFPIIKHLPSWLAPWKREGLEWHRKDSIMFQELMNEAKSRVDFGNHKPSFAANLYLNKDRYKLTKKEESWLAGTIFGAGSETTASTLSVFILAMRLYPDVMKRAQAEINDVVGRERLPTFTDREKLPYIGAIVKEVLRWRPAGPMGVPHLTTQDDVYEGYFIPKGTLILANIWAMNRDPKIFPDFDEFRPERFLDESGAIDFPDTHSQGHNTYGFGRRICVGMHVANQALFIDIASILWAASIEPAYDAQGKEIIPSRTDCIDEGIVVRPVPFECNFVARGDEIKAILSLAAHH